MKQDRFIFNNMNFIVYSDSSLKSSPLLINAFLLEGRENPEREGLELALRVLEAVLNNTQDELGVRFCIYNRYE